MSLVLYSGWDSASVWAIIPSGCVCLWLRYQVHTYLTRMKHIRQAPQGSFRCVSLKLSTALKYLVLPKTYQTQWDCLDVPLCPRNLRSQALFPDQVLKGSWGPQDLVFCSLKCRINYFFPISWMYPLFYLNFPFLPPIRWLLTCLQDFSSLLFPDVFRYYVPTSFCLGAGVFKWV